MTLQELEKFTGISQKELAHYYSEGLIGRQIEGETCFDAQDAKDVGLIRTLKSFGMTASQLKKFFDLIRQNNTLEATRLLRELRAKLLKGMPVILFGEQSVCKRRERYKSYMQLF